MQNEVVATKNLTQPEAYAACQSKMEYAASKIRQAALTQLYGGYNMAISTPVGVHGDWAQEHLYWLNCMNFIENQSEGSVFCIENEYLYMRVNDAWQKHYAR